MHHMVPSSVSWYMSAAAQLEGLGEHGELPSEVQLGCGAMRVVVKRACGFS